MLLAAIGALAACGGAARNSDGANSDAIVDPTVDLSVTVRNGAISAPDSVRPGWTRVRVDETEGEHIVVAFRMPQNATTSDVAAFIAALDTTPSTPSPGVALGGPEVGAHGDAIVHLAPGVYVLACVRRGDDGHRHASAGEARTFYTRVATAADTAFASPPTSMQSVQLIDFAYVGADHWTAGTQLLRIENTGKQDHQLRLARLNQGATLQAWATADDPSTVATTIVGMARLGPGEVAYLPVDLTPGSYIAYCLVADATTKKPHVEMGMMREIQVP